MATASISGLSSGLDTASIISQLMQAEAAPQTRIKSALTGEQSRVKTLQELNRVVNRRQRLHLASHALGILSIRCIRAILNFLPALFVVYLEAAWAAQKKGV